MTLRFLLFLFIVVVDRPASRAQVDAHASNEAGLHDSIGARGPAPSIERALQAWALARENAPQRAEACRIQLAQAYLDRNLPTKALEHAEAVLSLNSASIEALHVKAGALAALGQHRTSALAWGALLKGAEDDQLTSERALKGLMLCHSALGERKEAIAAGQRLLAIHRSRGERLNAGICANDLGQLASADAQHLEALRYFTEAINDLAISMPHRLVAASNRCAALIRLDRTEEALDNLNVVRAKALATGEASVADRALLLRSAALLLDGRSLDALHEASTARTAAEGRGDTLVQIESCDLLAHIGTKYGQYHQARVNAARAAALREILQDHARLAENARGVLLVQAQRDEAHYLQLLDEQQRERTKLRLLQHETDDRSQKQELARIESDLRSADLQRALDHGEAEQKLALARTALEDEHQMRTIQSLEIARTVQALELARSQQSHQAQEKEVQKLIGDRALQAAELERDHAQQRSGFWLMLFLFAAVLGGIAAVFVMRRKNRVIGRQVEVIGQINAELSTKNIDMLSSIAYAQRIQRAIIPTEGQLRDVLPDSFLFYRPLDIVSGDLPFVRREGERLFIATIDCTGHGVPAAMLSFMAYYNLNDIISTFKDLAVGDILGLLHRRIKAALHGNMDEHAMGNGMDITLVELDPDRRLLRYSGAQNSLLFVRDGECQRIKGDKCSIGDASGGNASAFRTHSIELRPTDHVYLYSDGFVHQFGGRNGRKKFSNAQLMKAVGGLADRSAHEAGTNLAAIYQDWQGDQPQTDDIVLIGFSIGRQASVMAA
jgi:serine phosphatase RsbU (regulator of sigma subunit)